MATLALPASSVTQNDAAALDWQEGEVVLTKNEFLLLEKANLTKAMRKSG